MKGTVLTDDAAIETEVQAIHEEYAEEEAEAAESDAEVFSAGDGEAIARRAAREELNRKPEASEG
jgi:hypothetical protein